VQGGSKERTAVHHKRTQRNAAQPRRDTDARQAQRHGRSLKTTVGLLAGSACGLLFVPFAQHPPGALLLLAVVPPVALGAGRLAPRAGMSPLVASALAAGALLSCALLLGVPPALAGPALLPALVVSGFFVVAVIQGGVSGASASGDTASHGEAGASAPGAASASASAAAARADAAPLPLWLRALLVPAFLVLGLRGLWVACQGVHDAAQALTLLSGLALVLLLVDRQPRDRLLAVLILGLAPPLALVGMATDYGLWRPLTLPLATALGGVPPRPWLVGLAGLAAQALTALVCSRASSRPTCCCCPSSTARQSP